MSSTRTATARTPGPTARPYGGHSRSAPLRRVLVRQPAAPATGDEWSEFGYPRAVDQGRAEQEHAAFRGLLTDAGIEVVAAGPDRPGLLDAIFTDDVAIMTDAGVIIVRPGKVLRQPEAELAEQSFTELGVPVLGRITAPGTVEGGDTCWLDQRTLAVGRGYRTNQAGIDQLSAILAGIGVTVVPVALPHWHGPEECLHLLSLISPIAPAAAVVYFPLLATSFVQDLQERGWDLIPVPDEEFDSLGCNALALAPWRVVVVEGNPVTRRRLEEAGCQVLAYTGEEISLNRMGGPTCLTRPIWRDTA
ncbi:MAG: arginine deiminase [Chloroflexia bacterium]|nr:arginine deiminase [Chloroflexia bacterium]